MDNLTDQEKSVLLNFKRQSGVTEGNTWEGIWERAGITSEDEGLRVFESLRKKDYFRKDRPFFVMSLSDKAKRWLQQNKRGNQ